MGRIALKMLLGDRAKYLSLVLGLAFAVLLITQQGSIFLGLLLRSTSFLQNVGQADLWVGDAFLRHVDELRPVHDDDVMRVRSVDGVAWAEPFFSGITQAELADGSFKAVQLVGIARTTLIGQPPEVLGGRLDDLRAPGAVMIEESSAGKLGIDRIGQTLRINDLRAVVVGFCRAKTGFQSNALLYTTFDNAMGFVRMGRKRVSLILVGVKPEFDRSAVAAAVDRATGLRAFTREELESRTMRFILYETGIGINFGITVALGFIVGLVVAGSTLYQFTIENQRHLAVFKAMGARLPTLAGMILLQASFVGVIGFGIGVGLAGLFSLTGRRPGAELAVFFPWQLMIASFFAMILCVSLGSLLSLRRVATLEPAVVFR